MFERKFHEEFNDFTAVFATPEAKAGPIDYDRIELIYREGLDYYQRTGDFAESVGEYFRNHGLMQVGAGRDIDNSVLRKSDRMELSRRSYLYRKLKNK